MQRWIVAGTSQVKLPLDKPRYQGLIDCVMGGSLCHVRGQKVSTRSRVMTKPLFPELDDLQMRNLKMRIRNKLLLLYILGLFIDMPRLRESIY